MLLFIVSKLVYFRQYKFKKENRLNQNNMFAEWYGLYKCTQFVDPCEDYIWGVYNNSTFKKITNSGIQGIAKAVQHFLFPFSLVLNNLPYVCLWISQIC